MLGDHIITKQSHDRLVSNFLTVITAVIWRITFLHISYRPPGTWHHTYFCHAVWAMKAMLLLSLLLISSVMKKKKITACGSCLTERDLIQINNRPVVGKHSITLERGWSWETKIFLFPFSGSFLFFKLRFLFAFFKPAHLTPACLLVHMYYMYASKTVIKVCWKSLQVRKAKNLYTTIKDLVLFALKVSTLTKLHLFVS